MDGKRLRHVTSGKEKESTGAVSKSVPPSMHVSLCLNLTPSLIPNPPSYLCCALQLPNLSPNSNHEGGARNSKLFFFSLLSNKHILQVHVMYKKEHITRERKRKDSFFFNTIVQHSTGQADFDTTSLFISTRWNTSVCKEVVRAFNSDWFDFDNDGSDEEI